MADPGSSAVFRTLQIPNFRNYMAGNFFSQAGMWVQRIAVGWLTWELTKSPTWLGAMAMADFFPNVIMAPLAGALADRMDRLKAIRLYVSISAVISSVIVWLTLTDQITVYLLFGLVMMNGIAMAFNYPVRLSLIQSLVGREALTSAVSINAIIFNIARIGGPATGWTRHCILGCRPGPHLHGGRRFCLRLYALQSSAFKPSQTKSKRSNDVGDRDHGRIPLCF